MEDLNQDLVVESSQEQAVTPEVEVETQETNEEVESATTQEDESNPTAEQETHEDTTPKGIKKRFGKLTRDREAAIQEANYWKERALEGSQAQAQPKVESSPRPQLSEYGYDMDAYTDALTDWKVEQKLEAKLEAKLAQQATKNYQSQIANSFDVKAEEFSKQHPDFAESLRDAFEGRPLDRDSASIIHESDLGPEIAYFLSQNEDVLERLHSLPVAKRLVELGRIETRLSNSAKGSLVATKQSVKAPPPPIKTNKGIAAPATKRVEDMTFTEFEAYEREQWRKKHS